MRAGKLDRQVVLQKRTLVTNEFGEGVETWADFRPAVSAEVNPKGGLERFNADRFESQHPVVIRIRFIAGISAKEFRLIHDRQIHEITEVLEYGRRDGLDLLCFGREIISGSQ